MARQVGDAHLDLESVEMVSFPASMDFGVNFTLTVGSVTWTDGISKAAKTMEEVQPASSMASPTTAPPTTAISGPIPGSTCPSTRRQLPRYQGKKIGNTDLLDLIDHHTAGLQSTLCMVESLRSDMA